MKNVILFLGMFSIIWLACAGGGQPGFKEPTMDNTMLVVGRVIAEGLEDWNRGTVVKKNISVAILGETDEGKRVNYWTNTDENGYFALGDVAMGEYVIKGIRTTLRNIGTVTIINPLESSGSAYRLSPKEFFTFSGKYFPFEPVGRVLSLQHNIFRVINPDLTHQPVEHTVKHTLNGYELINEETLTAEPVENYFIQKHPTSAWVDELKESEKVQRFPR